MELFLRARVFLTGPPPPPPPAALAPAPLPPLEGGRERDLERAPTPIGGSGSYRILEFSAGRVELKVLAVGCGAGGGREEVSKML